MKKKILSFVLAAVLGISLGCGSLVAAENSVSYNYQGLAISEHYDATNEEGNTEQRTRSIIGRFCEELANSISQVFNFVAGMVTTVVDASNNITVFSQGSALGTYNYNREQSDDNGRTIPASWSLGSINISGANAADVEAAGGLRNFLVKLGATKAQLQYDQNRLNQSTDKMADVEWLGTANDWLTGKNGAINHSISINLNDTYGASVTLMENGKEQKKIAYDGTVVQEWNYNSSGFATGIDVWELRDERTLTDPEKAAKVDGSEQIQTDQGGNEVTFVKVKKRIEFDKYGRQSKVVSDSGVTLMEYNYSVNGGISSTRDTTTNEITHYSNGRASYVENFAGGVITKYDYLPNGTLQGVTSYAVIDEETGQPKKDANGTVVQAEATSISAYQFGKYIGTADLTSVEDKDKKNRITTYDELIAAVDNIKAKPSDYVALNSDVKDVNGNPTYTLTGNYANITNIAVYTADLENTSFIDLWYGIGRTDGDDSESARTAMIKYLKQNDNGYSQVGTMQFVVAVKAPTEGSESTRAADTEANSFVGSYRVAVSPDGKDVRLLKDGESAPEGYKEETIEAKRDSKGTLVFADKAAAEKWCEAMGVTPSSYISRNEGIAIAFSDYDTAVKTILAKLGVSVGSNFKGELQREGVTTALGADYKTEVTKVTTTTQNETLFVNFIAYNHGGQSFASTCLANGGKGYTIARMETTDVVGAVSYDRIDPAVVGKVQNIVNVDGRTYVVVSAAMVDILDGNGFQTADGELIYIEITEDMASEIEIGMDFAAAGYIAEDVDGHLTLANVYESAAGDQAVKDFVYQITANAEYQANLQANIEIFEGYAAENGGSFSGADWKAGWYLLSGRTNLVILTEDGQIAAGF